MKITVFTSNQPRHLALISRLARISEVTYAVMECNTVFPGRVQDFFKKSDVMQAYFANVMRAEKTLFGDLSFTPANARVMPIKGGDLNFLEREPLGAALESDAYIVFGASYIKGWLIDFLVDRRAINIHMGVSPYYRGSSCNFWALYDERPQYVGATIHLLSKGLDSGPMLYHALPRWDDDDPFEFTMKAVEAAQLSLVERLANRQLANTESVEQDKSASLRYTRNADFTDPVAADFLARAMDRAGLENLLAGTAPPPLLLHPFYA
jgi:hypothetical protein